MRVRPPRLWGATLNHDDGLELYSVVPLIPRLRPRNPATASTDSSCRRSAQEQRARAPTHGQHDVGSRGKITKRLRVSDFSDFRCARLRVFFFFFARPPRPVLSRIRRTPWPGCNKYDGGVGRQKKKKRFPTFRSAARREPSRRGSAATVNTPITNCRRHRRTVCELLIRHKLAAGRYLLFTNRIPSRQYSFVYTHACSLVRV